MMGHQNLQPVMLNFAAPRRYAEGGLTAKAQEVKAQGRGGDTMLVHVNPIEFAWLKKNFGPGGINPKTGLPEFSFLDFLLPVAANVLFPGVGGAVGDAIGSLFGGGISSGITNAVGGALVGGGLSALTGGNAATGALVGGLAPSAMNALGLTGSGGALSGLNLLPSLSSQVNPSAGETVNAATKGATETAPAATTTTASAGGSSLMKAAPLLLAAAAMGGGQQQQQSPQLSGQTDNQNSKGLSAVSFDRKQTNPTVTTAYGYGPEQQFFSNNRLPLPLAAATGRYVKGGGTGTSDSIPAKLSDGEYVIDAQTVSMLGNGSSDAGAAKLDQMREEIRKQKGKALAKGEFAPDAKGPLSYMKGSQ